MHTTNLRKVGGSVMLAVPPAILSMLHLREGEAVNVSVDNGRLVVKPATPPFYSLEELLAQCDQNADISAEEREWLDSGPISRESI